MSKYLKSAELYLKLEDNGTVVVKDNDVLEITEKTDFTIEELQDIIDEAKKFIEWRKKEE